MKYTADFQKGYTKGYTAGKKSQQKHVEAMSRQLRLVMRLRQVPNGDKYPELQQHAEVCRVAALIELERIGCKPDGQGAIVNLRAEKSEAENAELRSRLQEAENKLPKEKS